jgi:hypothetical protein
MGQLTRLQNKLPLDGNVYYYLFSLNGFTETVMKEAKAANNLFLVTPKNIFSV